MKIGILGGSFDPVHRGHIGLAIDSSRQAGLDKVILVPARIQPFKQDKDTASGDDRINMLEAASAEIGCLEVSRDELNCDSVSYTYLTLRRMHAMYPDDAIHFVCGSDSLIKIHTWRNAEEILSSYPIVVGLDRPGYEQAPLMEAMDRLKKTYGAEIIKVKNRQFNISSTDIRNRLIEGKSISDLVTPSVERYIFEHNLYGA